jgi:hypothetical protein
VQHSLRGSAEGDDVSATPASSTISLSDRWDHFLARWGVRRAGHRVEPGLYALGRPTPESPVFVTANYTLSFDALRSALNGIDGYILVLDTEGVNVWCAAGRGTFGTDELARRIQVTELSEVVSHRELILPQLGAPGVSAHEVRKRTGFSVQYGPVRASDLPAYLETRRATPEMRRVAFGILDRVVLIPVELVHVFLPTLVAAAVLYFAAGGLVAVGMAAAVMAGVGLFPILLPWIPTREFSTKGFVLGAATGAPFSWAIVLAKQADPPWMALLWGGAYLLMAMPTTAFLALNFTGSTPFTSRTGVRREIQRYTRVMAGMFSGGTIAMLALIVFRLAAALR